MPQPSPSPPPPPEDEEEEELRRRRSGRGRTVLLLIRWPPTWPRSPAGCVATWQATSRRRRASSPQRYLLATYLYLLVFSRSSPYSRLTP